MKLQLPFRLPKSMAAYPMSKDREGSHLESQKVEGNWILMSTRIAYHKDVSLRV